MAAVVILHTSAYYFLRVEVGSSNWIIAQVWDSCVRWAVPVFVMISGALFLDPCRNVTIKKLYSSNIKRIAILILVWGFVYAGINGLPSDLSVNSLAEFLKRWLLGHYHMWFLFMIIGLYIVTPMLRAIVQHKLTGYFLILGFIFNFVIPDISMLGGPAFSSTFFNQLQIEVPIGYSFYFVLGYQLNSAPTVLENFKNRGGILLAGIAGLVLTVVPTYFGSIDAGKPVELYFSHYWIGVLLISSSLFCFATNHLAGYILTDKVKKTIEVFSDCSLGVYLIHVMVLDYIRRFVFVGLDYNLAVLIPLEGLIAFAVSFLATLLLKRIPVVRRCV